MQSQITRRFQNTKHETITFAPDIPPINQPHYSVRILTAYLLLHPFRFFRARNINVIGIFSVKAMQQHELANGSCMALAVFSEGIASIL